MGRIHIPPDFCFQFFNCLSQNNFRAINSFLWCKSANRVYGDLLLRNIDHVIRHTNTQTYTRARAMGFLRKRARLLAQAATCTTHNKHEIQTSILSAGFETAIPGIKLSQTCTLDRKIIRIS